MILFGRLLTFLLLLVLCVGCAPARNIESVKADGYNKQPQSILVFLPVGISMITTFAIPNANESYVGDGFNEVFQKFASGCGITAHTNIEARKDGKIPPANVLVSTLTPDWIMAVQGTQVQTMQTTINGVPTGPASVTGITYNVTVTDRAGGNKVWRANVKVPLTLSWLSGDDEKQPGRNVATMIINQMRTDGLLNNCPALAE